jgi:hypothetical protein
MRDPHVRFDERGWETGRCRMAQVTAPILDSTDVAHSLSNFVSRQPKPFGAFLTQSGPWPSCPQPSVVHASREGLCGHIEEL